MQTHPKAMAFLPERDYVHASMYSVFGIGQATRGNGMLSSFFSWCVKKKKSSQAQASLLHRLVNKKHLVSPGQMLRLGTEYGGWNIPRQNTLGEESHCYCAGAGEDISFDCALAEQYHCHIRIVDPTPRAIAHFNGLAATMADGKPFSINNKPDKFYKIKAEAFKKIKFAPYGLDVEEGERKFYFPSNKDHVSCSLVNIQKTTDFFVATCKPLDVIMHEFGDERVDLLKIDVEGAEYAVLRNMVDKNIMPDILLVEFDEIHTPIDAGASGRIAEMLKLLSEYGFTCIYVEETNATFVKS